MWKSIIAVGVGVILGIVGTWSIGSLVSSEARSVAWHGFGLGFGAGFGAVAAALILNRVVGYLDRIWSGKA